MKSILNLVVLSILLISCNSPKSPSKMKTNTDKNFYTVASSIQLRISPSDTSKNVIDEINSSDIHKEYCMLDTSHLIVVLDTEEKWSKVKVIEPDYLSKTYIGWIQSNRLIEHAPLIKETNSSASKTDERNPEPKTLPILTPLEELKVRLTDGIKNINNNDDISKIDLSNLANINIAVAVFKVYARLIKDGEASKDSDTRRLANKLKSKAISSQIKYFPKIRKAYFELTKDRLWEHDIYVTTGGNGNTILKFSGGYFAANANIKAMQEALQEMLTNLRFKQTQYRWYKGQDEFTYYIIKSSKDTALEN